MKTAYMICLLCAVVGCVPATIKHSGSGVVAENLPSTVFCTGAGDKPVCFSCREAVRVLKKLKQCNSQPALWKAQAERDKQKRDIEYNAIIKKCQAQVATCEEKMAIVQKDKGKLGWTITATLVVVGISLVGSVATFIAGIAVGQLL